MYICPYVKRKIIKGKISDEEKETRSGRRTYYTISGARMRHFK